MNYYIILGLDSDATADEIREAYRKLVQKYHPDHFGPDTGPFLKIQEAYRILSDPDSREKYDLGQLKGSRTKTRQRYGTEPPVRPVRRRPPIEPISLRDSFNTYAPSVEEVFEQFERNFVIHDMPKAEHPEELRVEVRITEEEARNGGQFNLMIPVTVICPLCLGSGGLGFVACIRCDGAGAVETELPLLVQYPPGIRDKYVRSYTMENYGIRNFFLSVMMRVTSSER